VNHDHNFKNLILDYPQQALAFFAEAEAEGVDASARITPIRQEQLQERLGERFRELDVPLMVEWPDGGREMVLFILEEESSGRRFSIHRLAHYCLDLAELFQTERVVPVVIFLRSGRYPSELRLGGQRHHYLEFRFLACDLKKIDSEDFLASPNLVARLNLPNMRYPRERRVEVYAHAVQGLFTLEQDPDKQLKYLDFIDIYAALDEHEIERYHRLYPEEVEKMSTFAERYIQQGIEKGVAQGVAQGVRQGEAEMLCLLLRRKFGELPPALEARIAAADATQLLTWSERLLVAERLDQVL